MMKPKNKPATHDPLLSDRQICADLGGRSIATLDRWRKDPTINFPKPSAKIRERNFTYQSIYLEAKERLFGKPERPRIQRATRTG
jgi:hypothetical protein